MAHNVVCKNADMAVQIIETVAKSMKQGTQRDALIAAAEFVRERMPDIPNDPEERRALAARLMAELGLLSNAGIEAAKPRTAKTSTAEKR